MKQSRNEDHICWESLLWLELTIRVYSYSTNRFTKLMGYAFVVEYKKGIENTVAEAFSRQLDHDLDCEAFLVLCRTVVNPIIWF